MKQIIFIFFCKLLFLIVQGQNLPAHFTGSPQPLADTFFWQEYHQGFIVGKNEGDNDVRSIAVDQFSNVWIATASGIFIKNSHKIHGHLSWMKISRGPAYAVIADKESAFGWEHGMVCIN